LYTPSGSYGKILDEADEAAESALREHQKYGIHTERMEFDAQRIIEQAEADAQIAPQPPRPPVPEYPAPDAIGELQTIVIRLYAGQIRVYA
jgi:hypothetical protein